MRAHVATQHQAQPLDVAIVQAKEIPGAWSVEAIDNVGDGAVYQAIFIGPDAEGRAREYKQMKFG